MTTPSPPEPEFSHLDEKGQARMVDVGGKRVGPRRARAMARLRMDPGVLARLDPRGESEGPTSGKGDVLGVARVAGIQGAKETSRLIPLCHPLPLDQVTIDFEFESAETLVVRSEVRLEARTGPEMEALTAVSVAALTVHDMVKAVDPDLVIEEIRLVEKEGGKSGLHRHPRESS